MRIQHNIPALNTHRNLTNTGNKIGKNLEKLSSGYRINRAGDDAAGLAISEKMRAQISGLTQARQNAEDGVSLVQTVEGAMTEVHSMLNRMVSLSVQSANGTYSQSDRAMMDTELQQLKTEITRISKSTNFNGTHLFTQSDSSGNHNGIASYGMTLDLANRVCYMDYAIISGSPATGESSGAVGENQLLADTIAKEYFPNAISQIFDAFPALSAQVGTDQIKMELHIDAIDGAGNMLAYAQFSYTSSGPAMNMLIKVDSSDFSDSSIENNAETLESTIAHELMHSVMQYTLTDQMSGRNNSDEFPDWFKEGTAQLAGGGFPTNWNTALESIAGQLNAGTITQQAADQAISDYLKLYDVAERPYGHGYLTAAYLGYLANGSTSVTSSAIAAGMNRIFASVISGKSLFEAISETTGKTINNTADVEALFNNPDTDLVGFVRDLSVASYGGAGSVIANNLGDGGNTIIGDTEMSNQAFYVDKIIIVDNGLPSTGLLQLMVGNQGIDANQIGIQIFQMDNESLNLTSTNVLTADDARAAIDNINTAIDKISSVRSYYGAIQNRLEHTINNLGNVVENLTSAESRIRDVDMAKAMMEFTRNQILQQSGQAMLAQANMQPQSILNLLNA